MVSTKILMGKTLQMRFSNVFPQMEMSELYVMLYYRSLTDDKSASILVIYNGNTKPFDQWGPRYIMTLIKQYGFTWPQLVNSVIPGRCVCNFTNVSLKF